MSLISRRTAERKKIRRSFKLRSAAALRSVVTQMVVISHAGFLHKKDGVSTAWRRLWFEVKGFRLTYFQREDETTLFNRSVAKRGQIKLEELVDVRRSQEADANPNELEIVDKQVSVAALLYRAVLWVASRQPRPRRLSRPPAAEPPAPRYAAHLPPALRRQGDHDGVAGSNRSDR